MLCVETLPEIWTETDLFLVVVLKLKFPLKTYPPSLSWIFFSVLYGNRFITSFLPKYCSCTTSWSWSCFSFRNNRLNGLYLPVLVNTLNKHPRLLFWISVPFVLTRSSASLLISSQYLTQFWWDLSKSCCTLSPHPRIFVSLEKQRRILIVVSSCLYHRCMGWIVLGQAVTLEERHRQDDRTPLTVSWSRFHGLLCQMLIWGQLFHIFVVVSSLWDFLRTFAVSKLSEFGQSNETDENVISRFGYLTGLIHQCRYDLHHSQ